MTKTKAIKLHCYDCAGETSKEVTLCVAFECPLWPFRTGESPATYRRRMETAKRNYAQDFAEMAADGIETGRFWQFSIKKTMRGAKKSRKTATDTDNRAESQKGGENA